MTLKTDLTNDRRILEQRLETVEFFIHKYPQLMRRICNDLSVIEKKILALSKLPKNQKNSLKLKKLSESKSNLGRELSLTRNELETHQSHKRKIMAQFAFLRKQEGSAQS